MCGVGALLLGFELLLTPPPPCPPPSCTFPFFLPTALLSQARMASASAPARTSFFCGTVLSCPLARFLALVPPTQSNLGVVYNSILFFVLWGGAGVTIQRVVARVEGCRALDFRYVPFVVRIRSEAWAVERKNGRRLVRRQLDCLSACVFDRGRGCGFAQAQRGNIHNRNMGTLLIWF